MRIFVNQDLYTTDLSELGSSKGSMGYEICDRRMFAGSMFSQLMILKPEP